MIRGTCDIPELQGVLESAGVNRIIYHHAENPAPHKVVTVCTLCDEDIELAHGYAMLHPRDQFCRRVGRAVSLRRAVEQLDLKRRRAE